MLWTLDLMMFPCIFPPFVCYLLFIHLILLSMYLTHSLMQNLKFGCHRSPFGLRNSGLPITIAKSWITYKQKLFWHIGLEISVCHQLILLLLSLRQHILVGNLAKPLVAGKEKKGGRKGGWNPITPCKDMTFKWTDFLWTSSVFHCLPLMPH